MILRSLGLNLVAGARLAFFLPVRAQDYRASPADLAALLAFDFIAWVALAAVRAGFAGEFDSTTVPIFLGGIPVLLAAALLIAAIYRQPHGVLLFAVSLSASDPVFEIAALALPGSAAAIGSGVLVFAVVLAWIGAVALRAVRVCGGAGRGRLARAALVVTAMLALGFLAFPRIEVWRAPQGDAQTEPLATEALFHAQGELIERALRSVAAGRPGTRELYFVGFAPDSSQDVFVKEMRFVKRLFEERFGAAGRAIALASSRDALEEFPIASVTNLRRALERVREAMNGDEDTLFLFITAHGFRDHRLSAVQPPLELAALTPTALARMLQDAGIKWRVIVVSACYSGGYIEPLRDDNSVVITASAPERNSFGCEAGRDFTYFGQAYFRDALSQTGSFVEAFELAKDIVHKQETEEQLVASLPQMWVGSAIAARLRE
ncbi:MAG: C13 family peptidase [Betaproteobacteria bacterium]